MNRSTPQNTRPTTQRPPTNNRIRLSAAAEYAGVSTTTLRRAVSDGRLPAYRFGTKLILVDLADLDQLATRIPSAVSA